MSNLSKQKALNRLNGLIEMVNTEYSKDYNLTYQDVDAIELLLDLYNKEKEKTGYWEIRVNDLEKEKNCIHKDKIREKIQELEHKNFLQLSLCYQHDNNARIKIELLKELLEED